MNSMLHVEGGCGKKGSGQRLCAKCRSKLTPGTKLVVRWSKERDPFRGGEEVEVVRWPICTNGKIEAALLPDRLNPRGVQEDPEDLWPVEYLATVMHEYCPDCEAGVPFADELERVHKARPKRQCAKHVEPRYRRLPGGLLTCVQYPNLVWEDDGAGGPGKFVGTL